MYWINNKFFIQYMQAHGFLSSLLIALFTTNKLGYCNKTIHITTYSPIHSLCHREEFNLVEDCCQTWYRKQQRETKSCGSFFIWPKFVVYNQLNHTAPSSFVYFTCICKSSNKNMQVSIPACNWIKIPWSANHIHFNIIGGKVRLHLAIFIKVGVIWCWRLFAADLLPCFIAWILLIMLIISIL